MIQLKERPEPEASDPPADPGVGSERWARHTTKRTESDIYRFLALLGLAQIVRVPCSEICL